MQLFAGLDAVCIEARHAVEDYAISWPEFRGLGH